MIKITGISILPGSVNTGQTFIISVSATSEMSWLNMVAGKGSQIVQTVWGALKGGV